VTGGLNGRLRRRPTGATGNHRISSEPSPYVSRETTGGALK
jgi:hypothetical protein